ncbi:GNAT family N-acetyltransferase [Sanguibacter sp. A247]|uniref:GNAT family N-acetyltransferase n=1 Tax=unclassified Sanguibacter TaxID=2645534 RepID=UPI003FD89601
MAPTTATPLSDMWPVAGLRAREGNLELRFIDDATLAELADLVVRGVHDPGFMPFLVPWTQGTPEQVRRGFLAYHWGARASLSSDRWSLELAVVVDGQVVGIQSLFAKDFPVVRSAETGSWLGREFHGQGIGTRMRRVAVDLAVVGLGADEVVSEAFVDNPGSCRVSEKVGYADNGRHLTSRGGEQVESRRFRLTRDAWLAGARPDVEFVGLEGARRQLGLDAR